MSENIKIENIIDSKVIVLSGRLQGEKARSKLKIENKDVDGKKYTVVIPNRIRTFNPSYFLGLFSLSVEKIGIEEFRMKYQFKSDEGELKETIKNDIEEGIEWALEDLEMLH